MEKIYAAHTTKFDYLNEYYAPLKKIKGFRFIFPHEKSSEPTFDSKEVIRSCDAFVAEVSYPSTGSGIEIGRAEAYGVPVLFLHKKGAKISSSLKFVSGNFIEYTTIESSLGEIEKKLVELTGKTFVV